LRILFTFIGGRGHFEPLAPIARAAVAAGHTVAFACPELQRAAVEAAGFEAFPVAPFRDPPARKPLVAVDVEHEEHVLREVFMRRMARERVVATRAVGERWRPDVLACEETDVGSMAAAELLGVPYATVIENASGTLIRPDLVVEATRGWRAELGLPAGPGHALLISPFPPSLRDPPPDAVSIRPVFERSHGSDWPARAVFFTLGTVFNLEAGDLFTRVARGLAALDRPVVIAVGNEIEPAELGPQPAHVRVERYVRLGDVLPRCAAVVSHGGSGLVAATLAHGLPTVLIPMGADQPGNAARCESLGVARVLEVLSATPDDVHEAVTAVLTDPAYREAAARLREEIETLPGPDHAVALLNTLTS
jgi:UDP:flavonoid glycosyltransferase YjiC (YdhE family)